ncbi:MAG: PDZ domain-containing protein [Candidatus Binataceae bacterium]
MKRGYILATCTLAAVLMAAASYALAQSEGDSAGSQLQSQGQSAPSSPPAIAPQGGENDSTLEVAPQPGITLPKPKVDEVPGGRSFRPDSDSASINPNYQPDTENGDSSNGDNSRSSHGRPYLGIQVQYTTQCYLGMEEHGLEILKIDPNSPAWAAGLRAQSGPTALGAAGVTAGTLLGPLDVVVNGLLNKAGSLGTGGDLIVAVDDKRVRSQDDLQDEIAQLKPGDTMYLTVIRPMTGGQHKTMKIAVKVGEWGQPVANAAPPSTDSPH